MGTKRVIWYNMFQTLVHAERTYTNNSGTHYIIIIQLKKCVFSAHAWFYLAGFWKRYHLFWCERLGQSNIPDEVYRRNLPWNFFARLNPRKNNFEKNLIRNGCTELVPSQVK